MKFNILNVELFLKSRLKTLRAPLLSTIKAFECCNFQVIGKLRIFADFSQNVDGFIKFK